MRGPQHQHAYPMPQEACVGCKPFRNRALHRITVQDVGLPAGAVPPRRPYQTSTPVCDLDGVLAADMVRFTLLTFEPTVGLRVADDLLSLWIPGNLPSQPQRDIGQMAGGDGAVLNPHG